MARGPHTTLSRAQRRKAQSRPVRRCPCTQVARTCDVAPHAPAQEAQTWRTLNWGERAFICFPETLLGQQPCTHKRGGTQKNKSLEPLSSGARRPHPIPLACATRGDTCVQAQCWQTPQNTATALQVTGHHSTEVDTEADRERSPDMILEVCSRAFVPKHPTPQEGTGTSRKESNLFPCWSRAQCPEQKAGPGQPGHKQPCS